MLITKYLDAKKEKNNRRLWIFRTLVANFQNRSIYDFVSAINLAEIEFDGDANVLKAWKNYRKAIEPKNPKPSNEQEVRTALKEMDDALAELVKTIGISLGYKRDKLDILNNYFIPQSWINDDNHLREKERLLMEILRSERSLSFNIIHSQNPSPHQAASQPSATLPQGESN